RRYDLPRGAGAARRVRARERVPRRLPRQSPVRPRRAQFQSGDLHGRRHRHRGCRARRPDGCDSARSRRDSGPTGRLPRRALSIVMDAPTIIARRIAQELRDGMLVNLGIGIPTLVANYVPAGLHVFFQSENGLIGTGAVPEEGMRQARLTDAGGRAVTALPGAATFDSAMSFGL